MIYLTVTDDQVGVLDPYLSYAEAEAALRQEQEQAGKWIGVQEQRWLGYPDAGPIDPHSLRQDLVSAIRTLNPDVIFTVDPWLPYRVHPDHVLTGRAVSEAVGLYSFPRLEVHGKRDLDYQPHALEAVAYYFTHAPNTSFNITATLEAKLQAIRCYQTQFRQAEMDRLVVEVTDQARINAQGPGV